MKIPCPSCIVFPICKAKAHERIKESDAYLKIEITAIAMVRICPILNKILLEHTSNLKKPEPGTIIVDKFIEVFDLSRKEKNE